MAEAVAAALGEADPQCTIRERDLFGFPRPGDPYWNEQTIAEVALRYPGLDTGAYATGDPSRAPAV